MEIFKRLKIINRQTYVYEIQPYYDKITKTTRQKSKYVGKYRGDIETAKPVRKVLPTKSLEYGEFIPVLDIIRKLKLYEILESVIGERDTETILGIAINKVIESVPMYAIKSWTEGTILIKEYPNMILPSQTLSEFLKRMSSEEIIQAITKKIIEKDKPGGTIIYDITSISSYSELIQILEYGHNRNEDGLPQVNFSLAVDKENGIPIMFDLHSGSIVDVSTLKNTIKKIKNFGIKNAKLIMDRGLFSQTNIDELLNAKEPINFLIPGTLNNKEIKRIIEKEEIENVEYLELYNKKSIFAKPITALIGKQTLNGYLYYNPERADKEKEHFYIKLYDIKTIIEQKIINKSIKEIEQIISDISKDYKKYFEWNASKKKLKLKNEEMQNAKNVMGKFILLYGTGTYKWNECLEEYNQKIIIEQSFNMLKNDMEALRLHMKTDETFKGLLFVYFISLIIRMKLNNIMAHSGLNKKYTFNLMMLELRKLKKIELDNGDIILTELTKKQKDIFNMLGIKL